MLKRLYILALLLAFPTFLFAQDEDKLSTPPATNDETAFQPNVKPNLRIQPALGVIKVDGELKDAGWQNPQRATNFSETFPGDQTKPAIDIEVWMTYDEENLYFAFLIEDDPNAIRVSLQDRDQIWQDDYVGVILDTYGDHAWAYFIASNPIGIQGDTRLVNNGNEDESFSVVFQSEGMVTETGYQVEMAVPFRSLRFPDRDVQNWNINFWITHPREDRNTYSWSTISRDDPCWLCQTGTVSGVENIAQGRNIEFLPALTGSQSGALKDSENPDAGFNNGRAQADPSLGIKYAFSSNLTGDLTLNPDFSQIESDAAQIDVNSTFALFFQERRPFFQEGSDLFNTWVNSVYTRTINNPLTAAKLTGRFNRTSLAYIGARDRDSPIILPFEDESSFVQAGESFSNIFRIRQTFGQNSHIGALVTDRRLDEGGAGSTFGADGLFRFLNNYQLEWQFVGSHTAEPDDSTLTESVGDLTFDEGRHTAAFDGETYNGWASYTSLERNGRHWNFDFDWWATNPTFRADNGFVTQNNRHRLSFFTSYTFYKDGLFKRISPDILIGEDLNFQGERKDQYLWLGTRFQMKAQTHVGLRYLVFSHERFLDIDFRNLRRLNVFVNSNFSNAVQVGGFVSVGRSIARNLETPALGNSVNLSLWGTVKPIPRLVLEPQFDFSSLDHAETGEEIFSGYIFRNRLNYQFTRRLFLRLVTQYNDFSKRFEIDPLMTYRINPFTAFYIGSTHDFNDFGTINNQDFGYRQSDRQFFFKFQYLFRV